MERAALHRLDRVAGSRREQHEGGVRFVRDLDVDLAGPDGLDDDEVEAGRVDDVECIAGRRAEAPERPT